MLSNIKMLLTTVILAFLVSEQHFSFISANSRTYRELNNGSYRKFNEKSQHEHHQQQHHHHHHQQQLQHQHRHQHHISNNNETTQKSLTKYWQHHAHHSHHQMQQQQQQQQALPWLRFEKLQQQRYNNDRVNPVTTIPTESSTINDAKQHQQQHQHHSHQHQLNLQYQHPSSKPTTTTTHTVNSNSGQRQLTPIVSTTMLPRLSKVIPTSSSSSSPYNEEEQPTNSLSTASDREPKHLSDGILAHNFKSSSPVGNHLDAYDRHRSKSVEDYANDYYYDEDDAESDDDDNENGENFQSDYEETVAGPPRVIRDHHHQPHQFQLTAAKRLQDQLPHSNEQQPLNSDQDYADDEPYRSSAETSYQSDAPGVLTEQKFRELGTLEAVQQEHERLRQEQEQMRRKTPAELAREHMDRMKISGRCSRPLPRVIHVSNETSKRYIPYCTILHRCGEDTGCCDSTRQICAAKYWEDVQVYFFVIKVNSRSNKRDTEVLLMRNHTECHCVDRSNVTASVQFLPRDKRSDLNRRYHHHLYQQQDSMLQYYQSQDDNVMAQIDAENSICRCPKHFDIFPEDPPNHQQQQQHQHQQHTVDESMRCRCDCLGHNQPCRRLQIGEEGFAVDERRCIADRICQTPTCLHGDYSRQTGRCPRHKNHKRTITRYDYGYG